MTVDLQKPFTAGTAVKEDDARAMKIALNRLGYYAPNPKLGVTAIPDAAVFSALKAFQKDHGLQATATAKPHDQTVDALNVETEKQEVSTVQYIWRTVQDDKVRSAHRQREGQVFSWNSAPEGGHPGEDYNCRCWAEPVKESNESKDSKCAQLYRDLKNARLQIKDDLRDLLAADQKAKDLRRQLDQAWKDLQETINDAGFDFSSSFVPGVDGKIPILSPILESTSGAVEIWMAYRIYQDLWSELQQVIDDQKFYQDRIAEKESEIEAILEEMESLGCSS